MTTSLPFDIVIDSPVGRLGLSIHDEGLCQLEFLSNKWPLVHARGRAAKTVQAALCAYFDDPNYPMKLNLYLAGTPFQHKVWRALRAIPVGQVMSYGALAARVNSGARAVANACRRNPVPIVVPCHRVVSSHGLGGYSGETEGRQILLKQQLLAHEGVEI